MARTTRVFVEDDGSFARFVKNAPKEIRSQLSDVVKKTAFGVSQRMRANAAVGPDAPHIKEDIDIKHRTNSLNAQVGYFGGTGDSSDQPHIALYNEFRPNRQPFMRPAAEGEASEFRARMIKALKQAERNLSVSRFT